MPPRYQPPHLRHSNNSSTNTSSSNNTNSSNQNGSANADASRNGRKPGPRHHNHNRPAPPRDGQFEPDQHPMHPMNHHRSHPAPSHDPLPSAHPHPHPFASNGGPYPPPPHETGAGHQFRPQGSPSYRPPHRQSFRPPYHQGRPYQYQGGAGGGGGGGGGGGESWQQDFGRGGYGPGSPAPLQHGKGRGSGTNTRSKGKKPGPPPPPPKQIYLYDHAHIERSYNTNHENSTAEKGERWWENPKNYLQFVCRAIDPQPQFEVVTVPDLPPTYTRIEFKVQTPDPDLTITGRGDAKSKKEAEKLCALDTCYQLEKHSLIEYYRQYGRGKKSVLKSPKDWTVNFFTSRRQGLPKYKNDTDPNTKRITSTLKLDDITGVGQGATREEAELAAATAFQQAALARGANVTLAQPGSLEEMGMSLEVARKFVEFYLRTLCLGPPYVDITSSGKTHQALWQAQLMAQDKVLGVGKKRVKKDAENMAYVDAALHIRKEFESIWKQFETTKMVKGKVADVKPPPTVHLTLDDHMRMDLERLMGQLSRDDFFRVRRAHHPLDSRATDSPARVDSTQKHRPSDAKRNPRPLIGELDIKQMAGKSARLYDQYQSYLGNPSLERIRKGRATLPITAFAEEITTKVRENDVVVLVGQTGCGKTTQLPQIILEDYIKQHQGGVCNIICTQPRRIAAISVASRVAVERGESLGHTVGYQVRFDSHAPTPGGSILYCTTGIFLRKMHNEGTAAGTAFDPLKGVTHIVVDEVHERDIDTDFLLVLLRQMMRDRRAKGLSPIKLILMSATIDTGLFASYFGEGYMDGQCPTISVPGRTFPVQQFYLDDVLDSLYKTQSQSDMRLLQQHEQSQRYIAREMQVQPLGPPLPPTHVPASSGTASPRKKMRSDKDMSADRQGNGDDDDGDDDDDDDDVDDVDIDMAENMLSQARSASRMPRDEVLDAEIPGLLLATTIAYIVKTTAASSGAILCFVSGWEDMQEVQKYMSTSRLLGVDFNDTSRFRIHLLHSTLPSLSQQEVFEPLADERVRKIILATNIAETSITIQDVVYVVDSAKVKETNYDPTKRMTTLLPTWISASSLKQRAGRAGRVQEGQYYCMMSKKRRELLDAFSVPEMLRSDLQEICLHIKSVDQSTKIANVLAEAIQPPDQASVADALSQLMSLGALDANENLTPLGRVLATLPVEPSFGRCLILSCVFSCLDPVLTLCASLGTKDVFVSPLMRKEQADRAKMRWAKDLRSDHLAMMNAYNTWIEMLREEPQRVFEFTDENYLSRLALENIRRAKAQLLSLLEKSGVVPMMSFERRQKLKQQQQQDGGSSVLFEMGPPEYNRNSRCVPLLRAMVCAGVFPNISIKTSKKIHRTRHDNVCIVHPGSVNSTRSEKHLMQQLQQQRGPMEYSESEMGSLFAFSTKVRTSETQIFLRNTTRLDPLSILLFAGGGENEVEMVGQNQLVVDRWWKFNGPERTIRTMRTLREMMTDGLEKLFLILDYKSRRKHQQQGREGGVNGARQRQQQQQKEKEKAMMRQQFPPLGAASTANGWGGGGNSSNGGSDYDSNRSSPLGGFYPSIGSAHLGFGGGQGVGLGHSGQGGVYDDLELEEWIAMIAGDDDKDWMDQTPMAHLVEGLVDLLKQSDADMVYRQSHPYYPGGGSSGPNSGRNSSMSFDGGSNNYYPSSSSSSYYPGGGGGGHHHHPHHHYSPHAYSPYPPTHHPYHPGHGHGYNSNENSRPGSRNGYGSGGGGGGGGYHHNNHHHHYHHPQPQHPTPAPPPSLDPREMWTTNQGTGGNMQSWF